jgi:hypothetical protein
MKNIILLISSMVCLVSADFDPLFVTKNPNGSTVTIQCRDLVCHVLKNVFYVDVEDNWVMVHVQKGKSISFQKNNVIAIISEDEK